MTMSAFANGSSSGVSTREIVAGSTSSSAPSSLRPAMRASARSTGADVERRGAGIGDGACVVPVGERRVSAAYFLRGAARASGSVDVRARHVFGTGGALGAPVLGRRDPSASLVTERENGSRRRSESVERDVTCDVVLARRGNADGGGGMSSLDPRVCEPYEWLCGTFSWRL
jgi:hypothetical protein